MAVNVVLQHGSQPTRVFHCKPSMVHLTASVTRYCTTRTGQDDGEVTKSGQAGEIKNFFTPIRIVPAKDTNIINMG